MRRNSGDLLNRLRSITVVRDLLTAWAISSVIDGLFVVLYLLLLLKLNLLIGLVAVVLAVIHGLGLSLLRARIRRLSQEYVQAQAVSQSVLFEVMSGLITMYSSGATATARAWSQHAVNREQDAALRRGRASAVIDGLNGGLRTFGPLAVLGVGGVQVLDGSLALSTAIAASTIAVGVFEPLAALVQAAVTLQTIPGHLERLDDLLELPVHERVAPSVPITDPPTITLRDVDFR